MTILIIVNLVADNKNIETIKNACKDYSSPGNSTNESITRIARDKARGIPRWDLVSSTNLIVAITHTIPDMFDDNIFK
jgi:hypothetical protein